MVVISTLCEFVLVSIYLPIAATNAATTELRLRLLMSNAAPIISQAFCECKHFFCAARRHPSAETVY